MFASASLSTLSAVVDVVVVVVVAVGGANVCECNGD